MAPDESNQTALSEVEELLCRIRQNFVDHFEEIEPKANIRTLRLFDVWRQVSLRRIVDLAQGAEAFFLEERLVPACTLTRSVVETVALQYSVWKKLTLQTKTADLRASHALLMSAVFGRRDKGDSWPNQSMNVLTAIGHLDKQFPGFRSEYDRLSEYLHPGLAGGYGAYVRTEGAGLRAHFGQNPSGLEMGPWGRTELERALMVAATVADLLNDLRPQLVAIMKHEE
jgi:hypothetical protein